MNKFEEYIGSQFGNPRGLIGKLCCLIMNIINKAMYRTVISNINVESRNEILDIGYGNGYLIKQLFEKTKANIHGIDISEDMLKAASDRNKNGINEGKIHLSLGDCCNLNFSDGTFDIVTSINTIYFWPDVEKGLKEIKRVLKSGGIFYNAVYSKEWLKKLSYTQKGFQFFEKEDYIELGKRAGFSKVLIEEIVNGKSYFIKYYN